MRSLLPLARPGSRRGLGVLAAALLALGTGCSFITGIPDVSSVTVSIVPDTIAVGATGTATAAAYGKSNTILHHPKVILGFESSNPAVAAVNPTTGTVTGVSEGTAEITARARDKSASVKVVIVPERPVRVDVQTPTLFLNQRTLLVITPVGVNGQSLGKRRLTISSANTNIVQIETDSTTTGTYVRGVTVGTTTVSGNVNGTPFAVSVTVQPPVVARVTGQLAKGTNTLLEGESNQIVVSLFAADGSPIANAGQTISFTSDDQTVATVNPSSGVVLGVKAGIANMTIIVAGTTARGAVAITVQPVPAVEVRFQNRGQFLRIANDGTGVPSTRVAFAFDSGGRQLANRQILYRSTDPTVFTVSSATGTVVGQKLGTARLIASADNGKVADTLTLTVTPVPVSVVAIRPTQSQVTVGQKIQFSATLTDSLGATVAGRAINWFSNNPTILSIDQTTGLATAVASGTAQVQPQVEIVPGFPGFVTAVQGGAVLVLPTPVATIDVQPASVSVTLGRTTQISITLKDANGATIFTSRPIVATPADPTIASAQTPNGTGTGSITGLKVGTTTVTFQALDQNGNPQGAPTTINVTVN